MRLAGTPSSAQGCAFKIEKLVALTTTLFYYVKLRTTFCFFGAMRSKAP